jgi:hypothetical protein
MNILSPDMHQREQRHQEQRDNEQRDEVLRNAAPKMLEALREIAEGDEGYAADLARETIASVELALAAAEVTLAAAAVDQAIEAALAPRGRGQG